MGRRASALPLIGGVRQCVAQVSKPAVSPTPQSACSRPARDPSEFIGVSKSAGRTGWYSLQVWRPAIRLTGKLACRNDARSGLCCSLIPLSANEVGGEGRGEVEFLMSCPSPWPSPRASLRGEGSTTFDTVRCFLQSNWEVCASVAVQGVTSPGRQLR